jgi:hypothetical protein
MIVGTHRIYVQDSTGANSRPGNPANAVGRVLRGKFCRVQYLVGSRYSLLKDSTVGTMFREI